ncbi:MAG: SDR family oxidoreductase [Corynebacterium sp.]|uniref:SDR family oxidoreductase n=1 Tax=Corynebacterium sp. TaxID=1720 RepID=UPI0026DAA45A|nr:SDR family oxidoreductase [Corynebacterium sp.]MDO4761600.1 SDR family oxidoreductase [Corynebacterium sp.]
MKCAVVTGASRGVGLAVTRALCDAGYTVYAQYNQTPPQLDHEHLHWFQLDATKPLETQCLPALSSVDALVLCAGVAELGSTHTQSREVFHWHMDVNFFSPVELSQALLPALIAAQGHVMYVNSGAGLHSYPQWAAYSASKHAARAWCEALRAETPEIRVTSVYPGRIATDMQRAIRAQEAGEYTPKEYLSADTVAHTILSVLATPADAQLPDISIRPR